MSPTPQKRYTPDSDDESPSEKSSPKKRRLEPALPQTPPPEQDLIFGHPSRIESGTHPRELLLRSLTQALKSVGFDGASREALEAFASQIDSYMASFLTKVILPMLRARRSTYIPTDWEFALESYDLPLESMELHAMAPISPPNLLLEIADPPPKLLGPKAAAQLFGEDLGGTKDKESKAYIPRALPTFPSKHTYKWTPKEMVRESDPRKIREQAAKIARQGEESLRKIMKVSKSMEEKRQRAIILSPTAKRRQELYERVLEDFAKETRPGQVVDDDEKCIIINADKAYWRKPLPKKSKIHQTSAIIKTTEL